MTAGTNISLTGTATAPIVNLQNPLTAVLNLGTQNITGTTGNMTLTNTVSTSKTTISATSIAVADTNNSSIVNSTLSETGLVVSDGNGTNTLTPTSLIHTSSSIFSISSASGLLSLTGYGGNGDGVQINQSSNSGTALTTSIGNVRFYPDYVLTNQNLNTVSVPVPQVIYERLTLTNLGLTNTNIWSDYGNNVFSGYVAFTSDSNSNVWLAYTNGAGPWGIDIYDVTITILLHSITLGNGPANVFYEQGGYMFIGGSFNSINGNATSQYGITRVSLSSYTEDPLEDPSTLVRGVANGEVFGMTDVNGSLVIVGSFNQLSNGGTCNRICSISSPYISGSNQVFTEFGGGVNNTVYAIYYYSNFFVYFGGDFTVVDVALTNANMNYGAYYYTSTSDWQYGFCLNSLNGPVYIIKPTTYFSGGNYHFFIAGAFSAPFPLTNNYSALLDYTDPYNNYIDSGIVLGSPPTYKQAYETGGGASVAIMNGSNFYYFSGGSGVWTDLGDPNGSGFVTGINNFAGNWKVIYDSYGFVRSHITAPHSCAFIGNFKYDNVNYTTYTITTRNVSQQFIGDIACTFWSIIGQGVGVFS